MSFLPKTNDIILRISALLYKTLEQIENKKSHLGHKPNSYSKVPNNHAARLLIFKIFFLPTRSYLDLLSGAK